MTKTFVAGGRHDIRTAVAIQLGSKPPSQVKSRRRLAIWLATEEVPGTIAQTTVLSDSGWHRYAFDLNQFKLNDEDRLLHLNINPLLQRTEKLDEQFAIGRIALKRRISVSTE